MPNLEQSAVNSVRKNGAGDQGSAFVKTTFQTPTKAGRLVIAVAFWTGGLGVGTHFSDSRFSTLLSPVFLRDTSMAAWYYQNAQPITSVAFSTDAYRGVNLRLFEVSGIAQASALDKFVWASGENQGPFSGQTSTLTASGEYVFGVIGSQYASTSQSGYSGGLQRLFTDVVPDNNREDWERGQVSFHNSTSTSTSRSAAHWIAVDVAPVDRFSGLFQERRFRAGQVHVYRAKRNRRPGSRQPFRVRSAQAHGC
jgi:hypothetical protein